MSNLDSSPDRSSRLLDLAMALFLVFAAVVTFRSFRNVAFEDAYITYRYAANLAAGNGFVFNPGERVFGTTTPLLTMLLAALALVGVPPHVGGVLVFVVATMVAAWLGYRLLEELGLPLAGVLFALVLAWGFGGLHDMVGMETPLYVALLLAAFRAALADRRTSTGLLLGALVLTRYDGILAAAVFLGVLLLRDRRVPWRAAVVSGVPVAAWLLFAWAYFGSPLPNTLAAKAATMDAGEYLEEAATRQVQHLRVPGHLVPPLPPPRRALAVSILVLGGLGVGWGLWRRRPGLLALLAYAVALWVGYTVIRPPPAHRWHLLPATYVLLLMALAGWVWAVGRILGVLLSQSTRDRAVLVSGLALLLAGAAILPLVAADEVAEVEGNWNYRDRIGSYGLMADWIRRLGFTEASIYTREPGYLVYHTGQPAIDGAGLVTPGIRFHGSKDEKTEREDIIAHYRPDMAVENHTFGFLGPWREQYRNVLTSASGRMLLLRDDLWRRRFPDLYRAWVGTGDYFLGRPMELAEFPGGDFEEGIPDGWSCRPRCSRFRPGEGSMALTPAPLDGAYVREAWTAPFGIDFDEVRFQFFSETRGTRAMVFVDGWSVFEADGSGSPGAREIRVPLYPYRGRTAVVRLAALSFETRLLGIDDLQRVRYRNVRILDEFEGPGWSDLWIDTIGDAPASNRGLARSQGLLVAQGRQFASTLGRPGVQQLLSRPFLLDREHLGFSLYDLAGSLMQVELLVGDEVVLAREGRGTGSIRWVEWNLAPWKGREAVLRVRDGNSLPEVGFAIDSLILYDGPASADP